MGEKISDKLTDEFVGRYTDKFEDTEVKLLPKEIIHSMTHKDKLSYYDYISEFAKVDREMGCTLQEIAEKYQVSVTTVSRWNLDKWGGIFLKENEKPKQETVLKTAEERYRNRQALNKILSVYNPHARKLNNSKEIYAFFEEYIDRCYKTGAFPTMNGYALFLGINKDSMKSIENGSRGNEMANAMKYVHLLIEEYDDQKATNGEMRDAVYIFRAKNYHGLKDTVETVNVTLGDETSADEIAERLNNMGILDADFEEVKDNIVETEGNEA